MATPKLKNRIVILLLAVVAVMYFLPAILYVSYRAGFEIVNPKAVLGITLDIDNGWYPIATSDTQLGRLMNVSPSPRTVVFYKNNWLVPWNSEEAFISEYAKAENSDMSSGMYVKIDDFKWGKAALVKDEITRTPSRKLVVLPEYGIGISANDLRILGDIRRIESK